MLEKIEKGTNRFFLRILGFYQLVLSPWLGSNCRFYPSCSHYAQDALIKKGTTLGLWMSIKRFLKCQPFHPGGLDPVE